MRDGGLEWEEGGRDLKENNWGMKLLRVKHWREVSKVRRSAKDGKAERNMGRSKLEGKEYEWWREK